MDKFTRDAAEGDLIDLVRRNDAQNFRVTISCLVGRWSVEVRDLDTDERQGTCVGSGASFTEAWVSQAPVWSKEG
jgi:hypothetical protein